MEKKTNTSQQNSLPELTNEDAKQIEETIGLFGSSRTDAQYDAYLSRSSKRQRIFEIYSIIKKYDLVHGINPSKFRAMLEELGPTFIKAGQILSMRSEILPQSFCDELTKLRGDCEPMPYDVVMEVLRREMPYPLEDIFDAIDPTPLGSASIAQVHIARLLDGTDVAVKVQRPRVQELMAQDIDIMRSLSKWIEKFSPAEQFVDLSSVLEELWISFKEETNFLVEARNLEEFRANNADCKFVSAPKPYMDLCSGHVVVMDYVRGIPISEPDVLVAAGYDLHEIGIKLVDNFAQQVMDDGFFHADPHPGNIIISGGKIVFIDLGMVGRLNARYRRIMKDMVVAVATGDTPALKDGLLRFSCSNGASADVDHALLLEDLDAILADYGSTNLSELDLAAFLNAIIDLARKNDIELPGIVTMLARSMVTLEGLVDKFLPGTSMVEIIKAHLTAHESADEILKRESQELVREMRQATHGFLGALGKADLVADMLTRGQLKVNMDVVGSKDPIDEFAHLADRLTLGVIVAGLYIGSSIVYFARMKPVVFGIPVLGFIGYMIALILTVGIVHQVIKKNKRGHE